MQDPISLVLTISGIMRPVAFPTFDLQRGIICSNCYQLVNIRSWYIRFRAIFIKDLVCLKAVILLSVWLWVRLKFVVIIEFLRLFSVSVQVLLPQLSMLITEPSFMQCGIKSLRHVKFNPVPKTGRKKSQELLDIYLFFFDVWYIMQQIQKSINKCIHSHGSHAQFMKLFHFLVK